MTTGNGRAALAVDREIVAGLDQTLDRLGAYMTKR